ncbi:MAG TPA: aliphatic sulfonate ABC transporter substrate-binding protein, partial [Afipia sp.]
MFCSQRKILIGFFIGLLSQLIVVDTSCAEDLVRIGLLRTTNVLSLAKSRGELEAKLKKKGVRVEWVGPFAASAPAVEALNAGLVDITVGSSTSAIASLAAKVSIVLFAYRQMSPDCEGILVKADSPVRSVKDLVGKRVAVNRGGTGEYLLVKALETSGVPLSSVQRVYLGPQDGGFAFASGKVDAWAVWDPYYTIGQTTYQGHILASGEAIGDENATVLLAARSFAENNRALLQTVFEATVEDSQWAQDHQNEAGRVWTQELNLPPEIADRLGHNNAFAFTAIGEKEAAQIKSIARWYVENK